MKLLLSALPALALSTSLVQAQRVPDPARLPRHQLAASADSTRSTARPQANREEACRMEAARGLTSAREDLPPGVVRATAFEFSMRERLCLQKAVEADEAQLSSHRHYTKKGRQRSPRASEILGDQVPAGASAKCRDGT